ncbi:MAG: hypothetical protein ACRCR4_13395 [Thiotrichaceae bacterium]
MRQWQQIELLAGYVNPHNHPHFSYHIRRGVITARFKNKAVATARVITTMPGKQRDLEITRA